ncbi:TonB [Pasteurella multocida subsp. multocida str. Anand1_cattle]|nr:TonB [Pasteurella multocida subsp. multocida str. Anand1_cattle]
MQNPVSKISFLSLILWLKMKLKIVAIVTVKRKGTSMIDKSRSCIGFAISLLFHASFVSFLYWIVQKDDDSANGFAADIISTHISMEMLAATVLEEPEPEPEPAPGTYD